MSDPYPAHIRDNPIMQGAFAAFIDWLWRQEWAHEQFCAETGTVRITPPKNGLDRLIDEATGREAKYVEKFVPWAITAHWGAEGDEGTER